jgi:DNA-3-methyladenine glycosylase II
MSEYDNAIRHLQRSDPTLGAIITQPCGLRRQGPYFRALIRAIVYQQVSGAAGASIFRRFEQRLSTNGGFTPQTVLRYTGPDLRTCGLSRQKAAYILDLAQHFSDGRLSPQKLARAADETVVRRLIRVKGIGRWTAEMFLMFTLNRPDVLPVDDLGIREAMRRLYALPERPDPETMRRIAEPWRPWRTVACWYLWRMLDSAPFRENWGG